MYLLYTLLTLAGMFLLSPYFLIRGLIRGNELGHLPERFGWRFPSELREQGTTAPEKPIWIHAVSVGEVLAVLPLAKALDEIYPGRIVVSTTTAAGQKLARERMSFARAVFYFPLDWPGPARRALNAVRPAAVLIVETEIWPNFLRACGRGNVPVLFVNGRLSERSYRGFQRALKFSFGLLRGFLRDVLNRATLYLMQSAEDAARMVSLGAEEDKVKVTGNLKYDLAEPPESELSAWLAKEIRRSGKRPVLIAGSVMAGEESMVLRAFDTIGREFTGAFLILAPRKPDQYDAMAALLENNGRDFVRRSRIYQNGAGNAALGAACKILLLDSIGDLAGLYRLADAVFIGGSLVSVGGHNILEPAAFGKVPVFGPHMENFREMAAKFVEAGASIRVASEGELTAAWQELLADPEHAARMGAAAKELIGRNRGATARVLAEVVARIGRPGDSR